MANNASYIQFAYAFLMGQLGRVSSCIPLPNIFHIGIAQSRPLMSLPSKTTSFRNFVGHVIRVSAEKVVRGVAAGGIVAMVQHILSFRNWAVDNLPCRTMGKHMFTPPSDVSIALLRAGSCPGVASVRATTSVNMAPKPHERIIGLMNMMAEYKARRLPFDITTPGVVAFRNRRGLPAATFAEFGGIVGGWYSIHVIGLHNRLITEPRPATTGAGITCVSIIPRMEAA